MERLGLGQLGHIAEVPALLADVGYRGVIVNMSQRSARGDAKSEADPEAHLVPGTVTVPLRFADECQSFLDNVIAGLTQIGAWNDPATFGY
jgi:hypothetical protein